MFHVTLTNQGVGYFLKGTTWTSEPARASTFDDAEAARAGLERARKFMKASLFKKAAITPARQVAA